MGGDLENLCCAHKWVQSNKNYQFSHILLALYDNKLPLKLFLVFKDSRSFHWPNFWLHNHFCGIRGPTNLSILSNITD